MTMRSKQWYTKTSSLANSFAKSSIGRRSSDLVSTTRSSARRPVESKFQICLARFRKDPYSAKATGFGRNAGRDRPWTAQDVAGKKLNLLVFKSRFFERTVAG